MSIGTSLRDVARNLINAFGNTISVYSYSGATKSNDNEGGETITDWKTATSGKAIMEEFIPNIISIVPQFEETLGSADLIVRDDLTIGLKDKITINTINFQVDHIDQTARVTDTLVIQAVKLHRME